MSVHLECNQLAATRDAVISRQIKTSLYTSYERQKSTSHIIARSWPLPHAIMLWEIRPIVLQWSWKCNREIFALCLKWFFTVVRGMLTLWVESHQTDCRGKSNQIKSNLFAISKVHNITVDKNYISLGWTDRRQLRTYVCP